MSLANTERSESKLRRAGTGRVVTPDSIGGHRLAVALLRPTVHDFLSQVFDFQQDAQVDIGQVTIPDGSPFVGQTIAGCDLRRVRNMTILAIRNGTGDFILNPPPQRTIEAGETLIVIGPADSVYDMEATFDAAPV